MKSFLVVNSLQKVTNLRFGIGKVVIFAQVYLLTLQNFYKALGFGIIVRVFLMARAVGNTIFFEQTMVLIRSILNAPIWMVHLRLALGESHLLGQGCQRRFQASAKRPA